MLYNLAALLAQQPTFPDFPSSTPSGPPPELGAGFVGMICCCYGVFFLVIGIPWIGGMWKVFAKAGQPGWAAIIPIYNLIVIMNIIGQPVIRILFYLIPVANVYFAFVDYLALARCFGKDVGTAIGLLLLPPVFWPILGFGSAQYSPPAGAGMGGGGGYSPPPPSGPRPGGPRPGGPQGGIRPGGPGGAPPRR